MNDPNSQVANSSHSQSSIISEPPDIRNWFSSYTYQSPILDSNELLGDFGGVDEEDKDLYVEDSENEEEANWGDLTRVRKSQQARVCDHHVSPVEVPADADADSLSLASEPPDIRNWFSSYVYESPTLDSDDFDISILSNNDHDDIQQSDKAKEKCSEECKAKDEILTPLCKETSIDDYATNTRSVRVDSNKNSSPIREDVSERDKLDEAPILHNSTSSATTPPKIENIKGGEIESEKEGIVSRSDSGWILPKQRTREPPTKTSNKENAQHLASLNMKTSPRMNDENILRQEEHEPSKCSNNRKALKERTNLVDFYSKMEVAGKWRCPQRSKPDKGPPMKQLRLENWVKKRS